MILWALVIYVLLFTALLLQLGTFWFVYGLWPQSWMFFWIFALLVYVQSAAAKWCVRKLFDAYADQRGVPRRE